MKKLHSGAVHNTSKDDATQGVQITKALWLAVTLAFRLHCTRSEFQSPPEVIDYASLGISVFDRCDSGWCSRIRRHRWHGGGYRSGFILRFHSVVSRRAPHGQGSGVAALAREITGAGINGALARRRIGDTFAGRAECWPVTAR